MRPYIALLIYHPTQALVSLIEGVRFRTYSGGQAGIGALIHLIFLPIGEYRCYFVSGKGCAAALVPVGRKQSVRLCITLLMCRLIQALVDPMGGVRRRTRLGSWARVSVLTHCFVFPTSERSC